MARSLHQHGYLGAPSGAFEELYVLFPLFLSFSAMVMAQRDETSADLPLAFLPPSFFATALDIQDSKSYADELFAKGIGPGRLLQELVAALRESAFLPFARRLVASL